jgi:hypothetical protein
LASILLHKLPEKWQKLTGQAMVGGFSWPAGVGEHMKKLYPGIGCRG